MAPIPEDQVDQNLKTLIQDFYELQSAVHGYLGPETGDVLVRKIEEITSSLQSLSNSSSHITTTIPPEIIAYVEDGRNPDIYTREFVELVQKSNMLLKGKAEAFAGFRDALAREIVVGEVGTEEDIRQMLGPLVTGEGVNGQDGDVGIKR